VALELLVFIHLLLDDIMKFSTFATIAALGISAVLSLPAQASVMTYASQTAYETATTDNSVLDFANRTSYLYFYGSTASFDGVTFTQPGGRLFLLDPSVYRTQGDDYLNNNDGTEAITMHFDAPVTAFALDFGSIYQWGASPSVSFVFAGTQTDFVFPGFAALGQGSSFIGFSSDQAFSDVKFVDNSSGLAIWKLEYATAKAADVPEPGSIALIAIAAVGMAALRRARR